MSEFSERVRDLTSRLNLRDRKTQLGIASGIAALVLLIALIALPGSGKKSTNAAEDTAGTKTNNTITAPAASSAPTVQPGGSRSSGSVGLSPSQTNTSVPGGVKIAPPGVNAPGVTDKEILVGATYDKNAGGLNTVFGFAGIGQIDGKAAIEHIRDYINKHGGIGGRMMKLVWYVGDSLSGKSVQQFAQEACTTFTQQSHVFAAFGPVGDPDIFNECMKKNGIVVVGSGADESDASTYKKYPLLVELDGPALDRRARFSADQLYDAGYFKNGLWNCTCDRTMATASAQPKHPFKLGIVTWDYPVFHRAFDVLKAELKKHNIAISEVAYVHLYQSEAEIGDTVAGVRSAVVRFKARNVTHVHFLSTPNGFEQLTFWQQSDSQRYYPRYGLTSGDSASALIATLDSANGQGTSARTFQDSVGLGWNPLFDVPKADYSGSKESPGLRRCKSIINYETYDDPSRNKEAIAAITCDPMFYLAAALEKGGSVVNQRSWLYGVAHIGNAVPSALTFDMTTSATRHDGMGAVKNFKFFDNCSCFHYTSGLKPL